MHGLVRHLEHVERSWIRDDFAGQEDVTYEWTEQDPDGDLHVPPGITMSQLLDAYAAECARCDLVIYNAASLDEVSTRGGFSLRWILLHLIEGTSRHIGHMDVLREHADGQVGEDPGAEGLADPVHDSPRPESRGPPEQAAGTRGTLRGGLDGEVTRPRNPPLPCTSRRRCAVGGRATPGTSS